MIWWNRHPSEGYRNRHRSLLSLCMLIVVTAAAYSPVTGSDELISAPMPASRLLAMRAQSIADALYSPSTPEHSAALRWSVKVLTQADKNETRGPIGPRPLPILEVVPFDYDSRYREGLQQLIGRASSSTIVPFVLNGTKDSANRYAAVVALTDLTKTKLCSGVVVADHWVLTAGHCVCDQSVALVATDQAISAQSAFLVPKQARLKDPNGCPAPRPDLALVEVSEIGMVPSAPGFASMAILDAAQRGEVVGYGDLSSQLVGESGTRASGPVAIVSTRCSGRSAQPGESDQSDGDAYGCLKPFELVAAGTSDECPGDSGGALYVYDQNGTLALGAIASRNVKQTGPSGLKCGIGGIYSRLDADAQGFISRTINPNRM